MTSGRRALPIGGMALGVAVIAFAIQTADEVQSPVPHKVQIAHWLETGLWVNPYLLLIGAAILLVGAVLYASAAPRGRVLPYAMIVMSSFVVMGAIAVFVLWEVMDLGRESDGVGAAVAEPDDVDTDPPQAYVSRSRHRT